MVGIAQKIELFNLAYQLAWKHISEDQKRKQPDIAQRLHDSIRRQFKEGATEPVFIACEQTFRAKIQQCPPLSESGQTREQLHCPLSANSGHGGMVKLSL
jgi:hypothetical protein